MRWLVSWQSMVILGLALMMVVIAFWVGSVSGAWGPSDRAYDAIPQALAVRRTLSGSITALGYVKPVRATEIECKLQRLSAYTDGYNNDPSSSGSATIIWLIPNGSHVKEGDLLAELDSSEYVELHRIQEIGTMRMRSNHRAAELAVEVAQISLKEFDEGVRIQTMQNQEAQKTLSQSELERAKSRLEWSLRMLAKGYISKGVMQLDEQLHQRSQINTDLAETNQNVYQRYIVPKQRLQLENQVRASQSNEAAMRFWRKFFEDRLDLLERQIELCKIYAPHDGMVIYSNDEGEAPEIEVGARARERQELFYIPDMSEMEIRGMVHETYIRRVAPGMMAKVRIPALQGLEVDAVVESIAQFPMPKQTWSDSGEVKNYECLVRLLEVPEDLMPGMTANLEILSAPTRQAITVPVEAVSVDRDHRYFCYVITDEGIEQRQVALGEADDPSWLEIAQGVIPSERVILDPDAVLGPGVEPIRLVLLEPTEDGAESETERSLDAKLTSSDTTLDDSADPEPNAPRQARSDGNLSAAS